MKQLGMLVFGVYVYAIPDNSHTQNLIWKTNVIGIKKSGSTGLVSYSDTTYSDSWLEWHFSHVPNDWFGNELPLLTVTVG